MTPGLAGGGGIAGGEVGVAEAVPHLGLGVKVAEVVAQFHRLPVVGGSLLVAAEVMVGQGDAVEDLGLAEPVVYLSLQVESLLAGGEPFFVIAQLDVTPADGVQRPGLPGLEPGGPEELERLPGVGQRLPVTALHVESPRQDPVGVRLASVIAQLLVQPKGFQ